MFISSAQASQGGAESAASAATDSAATAGSVPAATGTATSAGTGAPMMPPAGGTEMLLWNVGLIVVLVAMFYLLLIRPQQKRFREHKDMLDTLKKGDKVLTGGGLIGKVDKIVNDTEILVDLGNGIKVTALRSTVQTRLDAPVKTV